MLELLICKRVGRGELKQKKALQCAGGIGTTTTANTTTAFSVCPEKGIIKEKNKSTLYKCICVDFILYQHSEPDYIVETFFFELLDHLLITVLVGFNPCFVTSTSFYLLICMLFGYNITNMAYKCHGNNDAFHLPWR